MTELGYFEIGCKNTAFWEKRFWNLWTWFWGFLRKKLILKYFMRRTISKRRVVGVFWTTQYVSEVYLTWRRLLLTLLTYFYGYNAFGCIYILFTLKKKPEKISIHQLLYFGDMFLNGISLNFCKKPRNVHFDLNLFFHFPTKLVSPTYGLFSWSASLIFVLPLTEYVWFVGWWGEVNIK